MPTPTEENYLKALLSLTDENGKASISELGKVLGVSTPSVNSMVRKLSDRGLVEYQRYQPLGLTPAGRKAAALVVRKHRLTEMFLVEVMGFGWEEVHSIAEQIEHVDSPAFFTRMDKLMGHPTVDPHGSPIPDAQGDFQESTHRRLDECPPGETVTITGLENSSADFLHYLNGRDLSLHTTLTIHQREEFDGSLTVSYPGHEREVLSKVVASKLRVG
ncbi:DtxR family Mn-dependent transcriptional regulator [Lewinella aquimaris]|uniref:Transcriptional regulator MntR n=1 Tax=Neolewinella aquimaris TaxID=1835722 RepID=A0A840E954_9BACT|nr:metal-dependent transcriptional regulator [Neolewinella aquimaris]MBB4080095.1 DtxR family Mn-dependent transcriptional regulator [Neolewinella aquimaris]